MVIVVTNKKAYQPCQVDASAAAYPVKIWVWRKYFHIFNAFHFIANIAAILFAVCLWAVYRAEMNAVDFFLRLTLFDNWIPLVAKTVFLLPWLSLIGTTAGISFLVTGRESAKYWALGMPSLNGLVVIFYGIVLIIYLAPSTLNLTTNEKQFGLVPSILKNNLTRASLDCSDYLNKAESIATGSGLSSLDDDDEEDFLLINSTLVEDPDLVAIARNLSAQHQQQASGDLVSDNNNSKPQPVLLINPCQIKKDQPDPNSIIEMFNQLQDKWECCGNVLKGYNFCGTPRTRHCCTSRITKSCSTIFAGYFWQLNIALLAYYLINSTLIGIAMATAVLAYGW